MIAFLLATAPIICNTATHSCSCGGVTECTDDVVLVDNNAEFERAWEKLRKSGEVKFRFVDQSVTLSDPCPKHTVKNREHFCEP